MKNALILHGIQGSNKENWFSWLQEELKKRNYQVYLPNLPEPDKPNLNLVYDFIGKNFRFGSDSLIIGHSSGGSIALGILQKLPVDIQIKRTILVSAFKDSSLFPKVFEFVKKSDYSDTFPNEWDWGKIKNSSRDFIIFHSPTDPYVPIEQGKFMQKKLSGKLISIEDAKHFSISSAGKRFKKFPEILEYIE